MTDDKLLALADTIERTANNTLKSADWFWGWRRRDKQLSIAFGQLSRDLRAASNDLRSLANKETEKP